MLILGDVVHVEGEGWAIVSKADSGEYQNIEFISLVVTDGKPRVFNVNPNLSRKKDSLMCQVKFTEQDNISVGDGVFYTIAPRSKPGVIKYGRVSSIDIEDNTLTINEKVKVSMIMAVKYEHNFSEIEGTNAFICNACKCLKTKGET